MMKKKIKVDEFFKDSENGGILCTIEKVKDDNTKVKLTPWINEHIGCSCESSMIIDKNHIDSIVVTDEVHTCCGKRHKVVEAFIKENASIKVTDIIVTGLVALFIKITNEGKSHDQLLLTFNNYLSLYSHDITIKEIYKWLNNNYKTNSNYTFFAGLLY